MGNLVKIKDVAGYLDVSVRTIYDWVHMGYIPCYKFPKGIRFRITEVDAWLKHRHSRGRKTYYLPPNSNHLY